MTPLPSLIESGIAELRKKYPVFPVEGEHSQHTAGMFIPDVDAFEDSIYSLATKAHNAAIESALEALPSIEDEWGAHDEDWNHCIREARAKLSALKEENV